VPVAQGASLPSMVGEVYVVLRYTEIEAHPIPVLGPPGQGNADSVPSRFRRASRSGLSVLGRTPSHFVTGRLAPDPPGAPSPVRGRWRVDARFRRPEAK